MSLFKNEAELARHFRRRLEEQYRKVFSNINLASRKFGEHWMNWWEAIPPPAQPQIDLLVVDKKLNLFAIELKYFRKSLRGNRKVNWSYYEGIDESLALLRFGFECVNLWHCFDKELPEYFRIQYQSTVSWLIEELDLPIVYQGLYLDKYEGEVEAYPMHNGKPIILRVKETGRRATPILPLLGMKLNPFKEESDAKKTINFLKMVLKIPSV